MLSIEQRTRLCALGIGCFDDDALRTAARRYPNVDVIDEYTVDAGNGVKYYAAAKSCDDWGDLSLAASGGQANPTAALCELILELERRHLNHKRT